MHVWERRVELVIYIVVWDIHHIHQCTLTYQKREIKLHFDYSNQLFYFLWILFFIPFLYLIIALQPNANLILHIIYLVICYSIFKVFWFVNLSKLWLFLYFMYYSDLSISSYVFMFFISLSAVILHILCILGLTWMVMHIRIYTRQLSHSAFNIFWYI